MAAAVFLASLASGGFATRTTAPAHCFPAFAPRITVLTMGPTPTVAGLLLLPTHVPRPAASTCTSCKRRHSPLTLAADAEADVVVIGSGIGGLSCAALCAHRMLEPHVSILTSPSSPLHPHLSIPSPLHPLTSPSPHLSIPADLCANACVSTLSLADANISSRLAKYGYSVIVLEKHYLAGGCAHSFERQGYTFDSGPSLWSGVAAPSPNPLRQVSNATNVKDPNPNPYPSPNHDL